MRFLKAFGQFWYDFLIGDDWKIAACVVLALAATCGLMLGGVSDHLAVVVGVLLLAALFIGELVLDRTLTSRH